MAGDLRAEVEAAVLAELERVGPEALSRGEVARQFDGRGASRATLYRWIGGALDSGKAGQHLSRTIVAAAEARAREPDPPAATVAAAKAALPVVVQVEHITETGGTIAVIERIKRCIQLCDMLIAHALTPDGAAVRSAKLLREANDQMGRMLNTALRLQEAVNAQQGRLEFQREVMGVVRRIALENPQVAEKIVLELRQLATKWGG